MEISGKYAKDVKIFTEDIEDEALKMIYDIANTSVFDGAHIRIMPDVHAGKGITIGFTCPLGDFVNPEHIGVDIGCGIETIFFNKVLPQESYELFEHRVKEAIPMGFNIHNKTVIDETDFRKFIRTELNKAIVSSGGLVNDVPFNTEKDVSDWCKSVGIEERVFYKSLGTLGGGNHFLELDYNDEKDLMGFTVHTGSRNLGQKVCGKWSKLSKRVQFNKIFKEQFNELKKTVQDKKDLNRLKDELQEKLSKKYCEGYLSDELMRGYLTDMVICQAYAKYNRRTILKKVAEIYQKLCSGKVVDQVSSIHNYVDFEDMVIRKGAIRAYKSERMVVPFNMRDGLAICEGMSNADWNCSCSHGSGRKMSRGKAKSLISMEEFENSMSGIFTTSVCRNTLDEAPQAYKSTEDIIENIKPTCNILFFMKPVVNIKDKSEQKNF